MKVWITRGCIWDLIVRGYRRCDIWLEKPYYDHTPKGCDETVQMFEAHPYGWAVEYDGIRSKQYCFEIRNWFRDYPDIVQYLWEEICLDLDGCIPGDIDAPYTRWVLMSDWCRDNVHEDWSVQESNTFCLELDIPPELYWKIAFSESDDQCRCTKNMQAWYWNDIPF